MKQQILLSVLLLLALACTTRADLANYRVYGLCIESSGDSRKSGELMVAKKCVEGQANQIWWSVQDPSDETFIYINQGTFLASDMRKCHKRGLYPCAASYPPSNSDSLKWTSIQVPDTTDLFLSKDVETGLCIEAIGKKEPIYFGQGRCDVKNENQYIQVVIVDAETDSDEHKGRNHRKPHWEGPKKTNPRD